MDRPRRFRALAVALIAAASVAVVLSLLNALDVIDVKSTLTRPWVGWH